MHEAWEGREADPAHRTLTRQWRDETTPTETTRGQFHAKRCSRHTVWAGLSTDQKCPVPLKYKVKLPGYLRGG